MKWWRKAADQNDAEAQFNLCLAYAKGQGVAKDYVEAYKWCLLAGAQGEEKAKESMITLKRMMTREQIAEGQNKARYFKPREVPSTGRRRFSR